MDQLAGATFSLVRNQYYLIQSKKQLGGAFPNYIPKQVITSTYFIVID